MRRVAILVPRLAFEFFTDLALDGTDGRAFLLGTSGGDPANMHFAARLAGACTGRAVFSGQLLGTLASSLFSWCAGSADQGCGAV